MLVPCDNRDEAAYLTAVLNSSVSQFIVFSYVISVSTSTHVLENIRIPVFDGSNPLHHALAQLSQSAHDAMRDGEEQSLARIEAEIDRRAALLWGLTRKELQEIQEALSVALRGPDAGEPLMRISN
jgi:hypothetical protein